MKCEDCPHYIPCMKYEINDSKLKCPNDITVGKCGVCGKPWAECVCVFTPEMMMGCDDD